MNKLFLVILALLLSACATLSSEGEKIRITNHAGTVKDCKFIQQTEVSTIWTGATGEIQGNKELMIQAKNKAAELGGNTILIQDREHGYGSKSMVADVYKCNQ